jgi:hypothetical protein
MGAAIEGMGSTLFVMNCEITGCKDVALSARDRSVLRIRDTKFHKLRGAGILCHSFTQMTGENLRFIDCSKAGIIVSNSTATISSTAVVGSGYTGIEVMSAGQVELNEVYIDKPALPGILAESKAEVKLMRCYVSGGARHGIEANNGSTVSLDDTMIVECALAGVCVAGGSKFQAQTSELRGNKGANLFGDTGAFVEMTNCTLRNSDASGFAADNETNVKCNGCYFIQNKEAGLNIRTCRDIRLNGCVVHSNGRGGAVFESLSPPENKPDATVLVLDGCQFEKNSLVLSTVRGAVIRQCSLNQASSKVGDNPRMNFEILHETTVSVESTEILRSCTHVKNSKATIQQCHFSLSPNFAIIGEYHADMLVQDCEFVKDKMAVHLKDNSVLQLLHNELKNLVRPMMKEGLTEKQRAANDSKVKTISIRSFSKAAIEGNGISGDYDYAIYVDGQSDVDCHANKIHCGAMGGICYSGVSSGYCHGNQYFGKDLSHSEFFAHGCIQKRQPSSLGQ